MLFGDSNGTEYSPTVVFKAKRSSIEEMAEENLRQRHGFGRKVWKEVSAIEAATGLSVFGNATAWRNETLQLRFLERHFAQRPDMSQSVLLLLDDFSGHWTESVVAYAKEINVVLLKVPPRFTSVCQPADVNWMKPFKDKMRGQWIEFLWLQIQERGQHPSSSVFKMKSPARADIATWIAAAWDGLSSETIRGGYNRAHMRNEEVGVAAREIIDELESLYAVDSALGDIDSDDDFDR